MIATAQVEIALQPWLGARLSGRLFLMMEEIACLLNGYSSRRPPDALAARLDSLLFWAVREETRGSMLAQLEDGSWVRVRVEDFSVMADDLLLLVFQGFPVDGEHLLLLREYSMRCSSLAALRTLYTRFAPLQSREELAAIAGVARACHPRFRLRGWLME